MKKVPRLYGKCPNDDQSRPGTCAANAGFRLFRGFAAVVDSTDSSRIEPEAGRFLRSKEISMTCSRLAIRLAIRLTIRLAILGRATALATLLALGVASSAFAQASMPAPDGPPPPPAPKAATPAPAHRRHRASHPFRANNYLPRRGKYRPKWRCPSHPHAVRKAGYSGIPDPERSAYAPRATG